MQITSISKSIIAVFTTEITSWGAAYQHQKSHAETNCPVLFLAYSNNSASTYHFINGRKPIQISGQSKDGRYLGHDKSRSCREEAPAVAVVVEGAGRGLLVVLRDLHQRLWQDRRKNHQRGAQRKPCNKNTEIIIAVLSSWLSRSRMRWMTTGTKQWHCDLKWKRLIFTVRDSYTFHYKGSHKIFLLLKCYGCCFRKRKLIK